MDRSFSLQSGSTPTSGTGPSSAADGFQYAFAESSNNYHLNYDLVRTFPTGQSVYGITFQYHMYGATMGSVNLESSPDGASWITLWQKSGNLGNPWHQATAYATSGQTMLRFTYTSGDGDTGDFALDDIQVGDCLVIGCVALPESCIATPTTCDAATGKCAVKADGTACNDGSTDTVNDVCFQGVCRSCKAPTDDCQIAAQFNLATQQCPASNQPDGTACTAGGVISLGTCSAGECHGVAASTTDFESDLGGWTTGGLDQSFIFGTGSTPSSNTGPSSAAEGLQYVYAETSGPNSPSINFDLMRTFPAGAEVDGITFQYHMYGDTMGSAVLESSADGSSFNFLW